MWPVTKEYQNYVERNGKMKQACFNVQIQDTKKFVLRNQTIYFDHFSQLNILIYKKTLHIIQYTYIIYI